MMLQKLPKFLEENSVKLLIKYDGERNVKKYTIRLLFSNPKLSSIGKDTDFPSSLLNDMFKENNFFDATEMISFYNNIINIGFESLKNKLGNTCIIVVLIEERNGSIMYTLHIQLEKSTRHLCGIDYMELCNSII